MTVVIDMRPKGSTLDTVSPALGLRFGKRTADGSGTDQARFKQQVTVIEDPVLGRGLRFEVMPGDTAQWAQPSQTVPCAALVGTTDFGVVPGDTYWFHHVVDFTEQTPGGESELAFELHNSGSVRSTIAPHAWNQWEPYPQGYPVETVLANGQIVKAADQTTTGLFQRHVGGLVPQPNGGAAPFWHPNIEIPGFRPCPDGPIHWVHGLHADEGNGGWSEVYVWRHGMPVPAVPQIKLSGVPTMVWDKKADGTPIHDRLYIQYGDYGYPSEKDVTKQWGPVVATDKLSAIAAIPNGASPPVGYQVTVVSEDSKSITLAFPSTPGDTIVFPLIDGKPYLADGKMHPNEQDGLTRITIGKPQDGNRHTYGVDVHTRTNRDSTDTPS